MFVTRIAWNIKTRLAILLTIPGLLMTGCGGSTPDNTYTIGVVNYVTVLEPVFEGFKARMAEFGYVEGRNVTYIYHGTLPADRQVIQDEIQALLDQKVDLFLTLGTLPTLAAKHAVRGTDTPVVFAPVINPVEEGVVESITRPGGNVTGVQNGHTIPKVLEWLHQIVPTARQLYVLYHPRDRVALTAIKSFPEMAAALGVELVLNEVYSREEAIVTTKRLPKEAAIFLVPSPSLEPLADLIAAALTRGTAVAAQNPAYVQAGALLAYAPTPAAIGKQAARLVDQIFKGTKPTDLPVETAEFFLSINLRSANAIGLDIPNEILRQAHTITW